MSIGISFSIDVTKIDKAKINNHKNGSKYVDMTCFINDELDQYGNRGMITQSVSREEREQGQRGAILGNVRVFHGDSVSFIAPEQKAPAIAGPDETFEVDDIPF